MNEVIQAIIINILSSIMFEIGKHIFCLLINKIKERNLKHK